MSKNTRWTALFSVLVLGIGFIGVPKPPKMQGYVLFGEKAAAPRKPNVLMIAVDGLRPEAGCYGVLLIQTPNIDALARRGTVFTQAYCQQAVCSPPRTSEVATRSLLVVSAPGQKKEYQARKSGTRWHLVPQT